MDNLTVSRAQSPSFTAIYTSKNIMNNPAKKVIADVITTKLKEINPVDKKGRSYLDRAESYGYDVFLTHGKPNNSVRVDVIDRLQQERAKQFGILPANNKTHVGTYTKPEQFQIEHFNQKYNPMEKETKQSTAMGYGYLGMLGAALAVVLGYAIGGTFQKESKPNVPPQTTVVAKDTLKTDSIKPILQDTFKLGKKVVK